MVDEDRDLQFNDTLADNSNGIKFEREVQPLPEESPAVDLLLEPATVQWVKEYVSGYVFDEIEGINEFIELKDTPDTFLGYAGKFLTVKSTENGLEFNTIDFSPYLKKDGSVLIDTTKKLTLTDQPGVWNDLDLASVKYVKDAVSVENLWDRGTGEIYPHFVNEDIVPNISTGSSDLGTNGKPFRDLNLSRNIVVGGNVDGVDLSELALNNLPKLATGSVNFNGQYVNNSPGLLGKSNSNLSIMIPSSGYYVGISSAWSNIMTFASWGVTVHKNFVPGVSDIDIGTSSNRFKDLYLSGILTLGTSPSLYSGAPTFTPGSNQIPTVKFVEDSVETQNEFVELTDTPSNYTGSDGKFVQVSGSSLVFETIDFSPYVEKAGSITQITTRDHSDLQSITENNHHNRLHTYDSASDHSGSLSWIKVDTTGANLTDIPTRNHSALQNVSIDQHHSMAHNLSHITGGADIIPVATNTEVGLLPILSNNAGEYLNGLGNWATIDLSLYLKKDGSVLIDTTKKLTLTDQPGVWNDLDLASVKYVKDAVSVENLWDRGTGEIHPHFADENLLPNISIGSSDLGSNAKKWRRLYISGDAYVGNLWMFGNQIYTSSGNFINLMGDYTFTLTEFRSEFSTRNLGSPSQSWNTLYLNGNIVPNVNDTTNIGDSTHLISKIYLRLESNYGIQFGASGNTIYSANQHIYVKPNNYFIVRANQTNIESASGSALAAFNNTQITFARKMMPDTSSIDIGESGNGFRNLYLGGNISVSGSITTNSNIVPLVDAWSDIGGTPSSRFKNAYFSGDVRAGGKFKSEVNKDFIAESVNFGFYFKVNNIDKFHIDSAGKVYTYSHLIPKTSYVYYLGEDGKRWQGIYVGDNGISIKNNSMTQHSSITFQTSGAPITTLYQDYVDDKLKVQGTPFCMENQNLEFLTGGHLLAADTVSELGADDRRFAKLWLSGDIDTEGLVDGVDIAGHTHENVSGQTRLASKDRKRQVQVRISSTASGTVFERAVFSAPEACTITKVGIIPDTTLTGQDTNYCTMRFVDKGSAGSGTDSIGHRDYTAGNNATAFDLDDVFGTLANTALAVGDVVSIKKEETLTGLATPDMVVIVEYTIN